MGCTMCTRALLADLVVELTAASSTVVNIGCLWWICWMMSLNATHSDRQSPMSVFDGLGPFSGWQQYWRMSTHANVVTEMCQFPPMWSFSWISCSLLRRPAPYGFHELCTSSTRKRITIFLFDPFFAIVISRSPACFLTETYLLQPRLL